ncbi:MetQ/NlpA family ABC transporter substrate-binding protein [Larsenimonas suaedae]|uniref:Lipoprotein n=1 Tax=Larsenimonas suaedae TaxID=1851019 RepID=A0ABU1GZW5_9GAMM|nr:MetQ/NlpA family ABC transporter substrate-binding protein [Larsenimonas suaedae]MCM2971577.1 MetQ/NlpA family ABC transporter substrate-binding protein [Larsenimonas suaedae]MDR5896833.1 MetQ/NlpA family ABC transporter substrate-binding protein [Larsenimonas suaedae]
MHLPIRSLALAALTLGSVALAGCGNSETDDTTVKVGTMSGPETTVMETAKKIAKDKYGLDVQIVEFTDYNSPNAALADGSLDANAYQHKPYLESMVNDRGYKFATAGATFVYPIGAYSKRYDSIDDLPEGATIAIPNDPSNEGRSLILMDKKGLITLKDNTDLNATPMDISENPHNFKFNEIDAAQLPRTLQDVDLAFINNTYAQPAGLSLQDDALIKEGPDSPYVNLIVVREGDQDKEKIKHLVEAYQTDEVAEKAKELFKGAAVPGWE